MTRNATLDRRSLLVIGGSLLCASVGTQITEAKERNMYNVLNKITCLAGKRKNVASAMAEGAQSMPGSIVYAVSLDREDETVIWVFEIWESKQLHADSLKLESVQNAISSVRDYITGAQSVYSAEIYSLTGDNL